MVKETDTTDVISIVNGFNGVIVTEGLAVIDAVIDAEIVFEGVFVIELERLLVTVREFEGVIVNVFVIVTEGETDFVNDNVAVIVDDTELVVEIVEENEHDTELVIELVVENEGDANDEDDEDNNPYIGFIKIKKNNIYII